MDIASLVLGIFSVIFGLVPGCGLFIAPVPAAIGLILGIIDLSLKKRKENQTGEEQATGMSIAGIILNVLAGVFVVLWTTVIAVGQAAKENELNQSRLYDRSPKQVYVSRVSESTR